MPTKLAPRPLCRTRLGVVFTVIGTASFFAGCSGQTTSPEKPDQEQRSAEVQGKVYIEPGFEGHAKEELAEDRFEKVEPKGCDRASAKDFHEIRAVFTRRVA